MGGGQIASLDGHTGNITALAYSAQGKWIVTGSEDGTVRVWDTRWVRRCTRRGLHPTFLSHVYHHAVLFYLSSSIFPSSMLFSFSAREHAT